MTVDEPDPAAVRRLVTQTMEEHGDDADIVAARRADAQRAAGDLPGVRLWDAVMFAIHDIWAGSGARETGAGRGGGGS